MAERKHVAIILEGPAAWNAWREENPSELPNLSAAPLSGRDLGWAALSSGGVIHGNYSQVNFSKAVLARADLGMAHLYKADLSGADLRASDLQKADLRHANLADADLSQANLSGANLSNSTLVRTNLSAANLTGCHVYGTSVWGIKLDDAIQSDLIITGADEPIITVDNVEVAQFIYLLLHNRNIRHIIDTITSKVVLILGRFTPERKAILDALRRKLRTHDLLPVLFDFEKPTSRDLTETVSTLAHMARFIIADITDAKSVPQELQRIVPDLPSVPVQPLLLASQREYGMFEHFRRYPWVLEPVEFDHPAWPTSII